MKTAALVAVFVHYNLKLIPKGYKVVFTIPIKTQVDIFPFIGFCKQISAANTNRSASHNIPIIMKPVRAFSPAYPNNSC